MTLQSPLASEIAETAEWPSVALGEVVDILDSRRKPITKRDRVAGPYPYYGATGILDWVEGYIFDEPLVLIGEDGAKWGAGEASAFPVSGKVWVNNHAHVMRPDRKSLLDEWLIYYLNAADLSEFISGMTVPKLNQGRLKEIPIPIPPLDQQKRIVAVLDQAFAALDRARANAEANLNDSEELWLTTLKGVLGDLADSGRLAKVSELADHKLGKMLDKRKNKGFEKPYLRNINIRWFSVDTNDILEMKFEDSERDRFLVRKGDLLICEGGYPGRAAISELDYEIFYQKALHRVRFEDPSAARVLMYWLFLQSETGKLTEHFTGSGIAHFTGKALANFEMPIAEPELMASAIDKLGAVRGLVKRLEEHFELRLQDLDDLRQSILQKAFAGELT